MSTVTIPADFATGVQAYSGLPPRNQVPRVLVAQAAWLWGRRKYVQNIQLGGGPDDPLTDSDAGSGNELEFRLAVPAWTKYLRVFALAQAGDDESYVYLERIELDGVAHVETYQHRLIASAPGADDLVESSFTSSHGPPTDDDEPENIDAGAAASRWRKVTIKVWLDDAKVHSLAVECLRETQLTI